MAYPFSFALDTDLLPVWNEGDLFDLFPLEEFPEPSSPLPPPPVIGSLPGVPNVMCCSNELTNFEHYNNLDFEFPNPDDEWEHPLPIKPDSHPVVIKTDSFAVASMIIKSEPEIKPEPTIAIKPDPYPIPPTSSCIKSDPFPVSATEVNLFSTDDSSELDNALALSPEHTYNSYPKEQQQQQVEPIFFKEDFDIKIKRPRLEDDMDEVPISEIVDAPEDDDPTEGFKLPASKSPVMEAMVVCALNGWGIEIVKNNRATSTTPAEVVFKVTDFNRYYKISRAICSKQRPTDDLGSRIKSLRRWFVNFPKKKDRCENSFFLMVRPTIAKKVNEIIDRNSRTFGLTKRRRRQ